MSRPEPRPALQRSDDGSVHPAAPRVAPEQHLHPVLHAPTVATPPQTPDAAFTGKPSKLNVEIPKDLRKQVRQVAEHDGTSVDAVVTEALATYVTNR
jgi:hypothetical protein